jgi:hypothetical protein
MISDSLDVLGVRNNAMSVSVKALRSHMRAVGLAATVQFVADSQYDQKDPYGDGIDFLDTLQPGEVAVVATEARSAAVVMSTVTVEFCVTAKVLKTPLKVMLETLPPLVLNAMVPELPSRSFFRPKAVVSAMREMDWTIELS